jgi:hypothetical protein
VSLLLDPSPACVIALYSMKLMILYNLLYRVPGLYLKIIGDFLLAGPYKHDAL